MSDYYLRTIWDGSMAVNITVDNNAGSYKTVNSLLSGAQRANLAGRTVMAIAFTPVLAVNYRTSTPGTTNASPPTLDTNSAPMPATPGQKPNELFQAINADQNLWLQAQGGATTTVALVLNYVNNDSIA